MTNERARPSGSRTADAELRSWLFAALTTGALLVVLWYAFRTKPQTTREETTETDSSCYFVGNWSDHARLADWEKMLHVWARLADPTLMVLPDEQLGFSRVRQTKRALPETPVPEYRFQVVLSAEAEWPALRLAAPPRPLPDEARLRWSLALPELPPVPELIPLPERILWRAPDGRLLDGMPQLDVPTVRKAVQDSGRPRCPTLVEVSLGDAQSPTRVRVRRASGNAQLDLYVVGALLQDIGAYERRKRFLANADRPPYLPPPGGSVRVEVEWSLLPVELPSSE